MSDRRKIKTISVEYADGGHATWHGNGTVETVRTPRSAQGPPVLQDSDVSFVEARMTYDRLAWDPQAEPVAPDPYSAEAMRVPAGEGGA